MSLKEVSLTSGTPALPINGWMQAPPVCPGTTVPGTGTIPYIFELPFRGIVTNLAVRMRPDGTHEVRIGSLIQVLEDGMGSSNSGRLVYTDKAMPIVLM